MAIALLVGLATAGPGWLSAGAAYVTGIVLWTFAYLRPSPPWAPSDDWTVETWTFFVFQQVLVGAVLYAILGMIGSRISPWRIRLAAR